MTGYELSKAFNSSINFIWHAQTSQIYLELNKLEQKGLVAGELVLQTEKPNKKIFSITPEGKQEFMKWLCGDNRDFTKGMKNEFLMKIFFSGSNPPEKTVALLKNFLDDCSRFLLEVKSVPGIVVQQYREVVEPQHPQYWDFSVDFVLSYMEMCICWAERCIKRLEEKG